MPVAFELPSKTLTFAPNADGYINLTFAETGEAIPTFSWTDPNNDTIASGLPSPALLLSNTSVSDQGVYTCVAEFHPQDNVMTTWVVGAEVIVGEFVRTASLSPNARNMKVLLYAHNVSSTRT